MKLSLAIVLFIFFFDTVNEVPDLNSGLQMCFGDYTNQISCTLLYFLDFFFVLTECNTKQVLTRLEILLTSALV